MDNVRKNIVDEMYSFKRKTFKRRRVKCIRKFETLQCDLGVMEQFKSYNNGYSYILFVIDIFSKYLWVRALKSKQAVEVAGAFQSILNELKELNADIRHVHSDAGSEFKGDFKKLLKENGINGYITHTGLKASICERVIRTIKQKLFKAFAYNSLNKSEKTMFRWVDIIQDIVKDYNNTPHSTLKGLIPSKIGKKEEKFLQKHVYNKPKIRRIPKFSVNEQVRISRGEKNIFRKGYESGFSAEIFTIVEVHQTDPVTYTLENFKKEKLKGKFYEEEMVKVKNKDIWLVERVLAKKGRKIKVKWFGLKGEDSESWINLDDLV